MASPTEPRTRSRRRPVAGSLAILAATGLVAALLAACGGATSSSDVAPVGAPMTGGGAVPEVAPAPAIGTDVARSSSGVATDAAAPATGAVGSAAADQQIVIRTGLLTLEVDAIDESVAAAKAIVLGLGGYVSNTQAYDTPEQQYASVTYRIPADRWDDALAALRKLGTKVTNERTDAIEVTGQVLDLDARLRNLRATETQLLEILKKATRIADILDVQVQLTDVRGQIEVIATEKKHLEEQAALGTLTVEFVVPVAAVEVTQSGWDVGRQIDAAVAALIGLGQWLVSAAIWLVVVALPALVVLLVVGLVLRAVARRLRLRLPAIRGAGRSTDGKTGGPKDGTAA